MSLLFIQGGWGKLLAPASTQAMLASHHLPMVKYGWMLAVIVELGGGLAILFGLFTRAVGLVLAVWCIATAVGGVVAWSSASALRADLRSSAALLPELFGAIGFGGATAGSADESVYA